MSTYFAWFMAPRYGHSNVVVYIVICSAIGSLSVMGCKGLGLALKQTISGKSNEATNWLTWALLLTVITCIVVQMNYLNKALDVFNTSIVTPIYYVFFTTLVIVASAILFKEWQHLGPEDIIGNICGFLVVIIAIFLLNAFRDMDVSLSDVRSILRPKHDVSASRNVHVSVHSVAKYHAAPQCDEEALIPGEDHGAYSSIGTTHCR